MLINGIMFNPGVSFGGGVLFGGVNFFELKDKDLAIEDKGSFWEIVGFY